jgi:CRISPR-associated endonuclease/helicase Cas3
MSELTAGDFSAFFEEIHGCRPFPWQARLAAGVCESGAWPEGIDLPTASGKTACIDVAVFAMAVRRAGPRRIFFVVDRRVVVDAAFERMQKLERALRDPAGDVGRAVAARLKELARSECPLSTYVLRGGIYRDDSWVRSPLQPMLVASTVDQVGSRLLFRGYGTGEKSWPIHAGLVANDSLILLDEAHCSRAFAQTVDAVARKYRGWAAAGLGRPFALVEMTATPAREANAVFRLEEEDYGDERLRRRLFASKPARLVVSKARARDLARLAQDLAAEALKMAKAPGVRRIAVMVNRVRTARLVYEGLKKAGERVHLLIGRMRAVDRAALPEDLAGMVSGSPRAAEGEPVFVVATQCLEVGADLDFDALVTECASVDALLQRFGRLDRTGEFGAGGGAAQGAIVISGAMTEGKYEDPVYGGALTKTWNWLTAGGRVEAEFAIRTESGDGSVRERLAGEGAEAWELRRESPDAPVLLPAHLDVLAQTSPRPAVEPDVSLFLHGVQEGAPEVQVVWRADLKVDAPEEWVEVVGLCSPVAAEAMPVTLPQFRRWLMRGGEDAAESDLEGVREEGEAGGEPRCPVLRWRGDESELLLPGKDGIGPEDLRPGDTLILASESGGWDELGHVPGGLAAGAAGIDRAEEAREALRRGKVLRLHRVLLERWPESAAKAALVEAAQDREIDAGVLVERLKDYRESVTDGPEWLKAALAGKLERWELNAYPGEGWVLSEPVVEADSGEDESSAGAPLPLARHLSEVAKAVGELAEALIEDEGVRRSVVRAAESHDCGKADRRFQALLLGGDPVAAEFAPVLLAKGKQARRSAAVRRAQWARSGLPAGFRHELISLLLAGVDGDLAADDLALHLIASHHGRCRPFAPVVEDGGDAIAYNGWRVSAEDRAARAAHRLDSGVAERFWRLTRRFGWWGLAYLECVMRLGDWKASADAAGGQ